MHYNVREKTFPDGLVQSTRFEKYRFKGKRSDMKKVGGPSMHGSGDTVERKEYENMKRAKQVVWDLGRSNSFDWWVTLTFSSEMVDDRYDYKCCSDAMQKFTKYLGKRHCKYLFVPDMHGDGGIHFHGLLSGDLKFTRSINPHTGKLLFDDHGRPCYNIVDYKLGFTSAVPLDGSPAVITYLTQYYTKNRKMIVPKGCKRYWASRNLVRPAVSYGDQDIMSFLTSRYVGAAYTRNMESPFGSGIFVETSEEMIYAQQEKMGKRFEVDTAPEQIYREEDSGGTWPTQQNKE